MEKLDLMTYLRLKQALEYKSLWTADDYRNFRKSFGVDRETIIPRGMVPTMLQYRKAEYNQLSDTGWRGKFSEISERISIKLTKGETIRWIEFAAHKPGERDMSYGRRPVEKKTGAGDWLVSKKAHTREAIVREYRRKTTLLHWETRYFDIVCQWNQLMEYLDGYTMRNSTEPTGAEFWFKSSPKLSDDGDRWILELQNWDKSQRKISFLQECPYNRA